MRVADLSQVVPGIFFDLNPAKRRDLFDSPCHHFVRLSYGPKMEALKKGLDGIERIIKKYVIHSLLSPCLRFLQPVDNQNAQVQRERAGGIINRFMDCSTLLYPS